MRPVIVCLCGSTRFYREFMEHNYRETMLGRIVLSVGFYHHASGEIHGEGVGIAEDQKEMLDELHKRKIDLADEILVLNVGGYIGSSTTSDIEHAKKRAKGIRFLEPACPHCLKPYSEGVGITRAWRIRRERRPEAYFPHAPLQPGDIEHVSDSIKCPSCGHSHTIADQPR